MEIIEETIHHVSVLRLKGRLDAASARRLKERVEALSDEKRLKLVLDMAGVDFIDSSGLGTLITSLRILTRQGGDIRLSGLQERVKNIFELTRLDRIFGIYGDSEAAAVGF